MGFSRDANPQPRTDSLRRMKNCLVSMPDRQASNRRPRVPKRVTIDQLSSFPSCPVERAAWVSGAAAGALGSVDEVPDPESGGSDKDEAEVAVGGLVVSGGQSATVLEL
jgi:hypothetical protein